MEINFYVGKNSGMRYRLLLACKLIEKARAQKLSTYIYTDSWQISEQLDEVLWTYNDVSFVPHAIFSNQDTDEDVPVLIGHDDVSFPQRDFLINMSNDTPSFMTKFNKMAEILDQEGEILVAGRKRYAQYRQQGYTLNYYQL